MIAENQFLVAKYLPRFIRCPYSENKTHDNTQHIQRIRQRQFHLYALKDERVDPSVSQTTNWSPSTDDLDWGVPSIRLISQPSTDPFKRSKCRLIFDFHLHQRS